MHRTNRTQEPRPEAADGSGRVLFMDDEEFIREVAQAMLEKLSFEVECAKDGAEAVDLYRNRLKEGKPFDIVIMDLTVPGGAGGREAITGLLEIDPNVKAVVSSGYSTDPVMATYREYGFSAALGKPFRLEELCRVLRELGF